MSQRSSWSGAYLPPSALLQTWALSEALGCHISTIVPPQFDSISPLRGTVRDGGRTSNTQTTKDECTPAAHPGQIDLGGRGGYSRTGKVGVSRSVRDPSQRHLGLASGLSHVGEGLSEVPGDVAQGTTSTFHIRPQLMNGRAHSTTKVGFGHEMRAAQGGALWNE